VGRRGNHIYYTPCENGTTYIPSGVLEHSGMIFIGLMGENGTKRITSSLLPYRVGKGSDPNDMADAGHIDSLVSRLEKVLGEMELTGAVVRGATFIPKVEPDGTISWTNNQDLPNPAPQNIKGPKGDKGDAFQYADFTPEQLAGLKGDKGDPFKYTDFTQQQLEGLRGPQGVKGDQGLKGDKGDPFKYTDFTPEQLETLRGPQGEPGIAPQEMQTLAQQVRDDAGKVQASTQLIQSSATQISENKNAITKLESDTTVLHTTKGNPCVMSDSASWSVKGLKLFGQSHQWHTTGAQLLNPEWAEKKKVVDCGATFELQPDGAVAVSGKIDSGAGATFWYKDILPLLPKGETVTFCSQSQWGNM
ncbi:hypothetical protein EVA_10284, partial [gut metagenome]